MFRFCAILLWGACLVAVSSTENQASEESVKSVESIGTRIMGGHYAIRGQFPWHVGLSVSRVSSRGYCGGSLIDNQWILTAAHCLTDGVESIKVVLGTILLSGSDPGRQEIYASKWYSHEEYDIGLVKLPKPVNENAFIKHIPLSNIDLSQNMIVTAIGWGQSEPEYNDDDDDDDYNYDDYDNDKDNLLRFTNIIIKKCSVKGNNNKFFCAKGPHLEGVCFGDSGGSAVYYVNDNQPILSGVAIGGYNSACNSRRPDLFINVNKFRDWISRTIGTNN